MLTYPDLVPPTRPQTERFYAQAVEVLNAILEEQPKINGIAVIEGPAQDDGAPSVATFDIPDPMWTGPDCMPRVACWIAKATGARQVAVACEAWQAPLSAAAGINDMAAVESVAAQSGSRPSEHPQRRRVMLVMIYGPGFQIAAMPALDESGPRPRIATEPLPEAKTRIGGMAAMPLPTAH